MTINKELRDALAKVGLHGIVYHEFGCFTWSYCSHNIKSAITTAMWSLKGIPQFQDNLDVYNFDPADVETIHLERKVEDLTYYFEFIDSDGNHVMVGFALDDKTAYYTYN